MSSYLVVVYRLIGAFFALLGNYKAVTFVDGGSWVYWTTQSNVTVAIVFLWGAIATLRTLRGRPTRQPPAWLAGLATMAIIVTGLVAKFVLAPAPPTDPKIFLGLTTGNMAHEIVPIMAPFDWLVFTPHRRLRWRTPVLWLAYPLAYFAMALIRGALWPADGYPYFFVDLAHLGWAGMGRSMITYLPAIYLLGLALVALDHALPRRALVGDPSTRTRPASHPTPLAPTGAAH